jgi:uncharacterized protein (DUF1778 family)
MAATTLNRIALGLRITREQHRLVAEAAAANTVPSTASF